MRTPVSLVRFCLTSLLGLTGAALAHPASATGQQACNETSYVLYLALGIPENGQVRVEGWTRLRPGQCRTVLPAPFGDEPYYAYAYSSPAHAGGRHQWSGRTGFCVDMNGDFSTLATDTCSDPGHHIRKFSIINVNPPNGDRTLFSEPNEYGARAELAGIQRLLKDNGYRISSVDGYNGRRTRDAIRRFLAAHKISRRPDNPGFIDALEKAALDNLATTGMHVCNQTAAPVWTAYGRHQGRHWLSRGWWKIEPRTCLPLISGLLKDKTVYLYAGKTGPNGEQPLKAASENFCMLDILFSVTGRKNCQLRGFEKRAFAPYRNNSGRGLTITLHDDEFSKSKPLAGLRK